MRLDKWNDLCRQYDKEYIRKHHDGGNLHILSNYLGTVDEETKVKAMLDKKKQIRKFSRRFK